VPFTNFLRNTDTVDLENNTYDINFDAPDTHFDNLGLFSDAWAEKFRIVLMEKTPQKNPNRML
jgi:hypothetical protein